MSSQVHCNLFIYIYNGAHDEHHWAECLCGLRTKKLTLVKDGSCGKARLDLLNTPSHSNLQSRCSL